MKLMLFSAVAAVMAVLLTGCRTNLAERKAGPEEEAWEKSIRSSYPAWQGCPTYPPAVNINQGTDVTTEGVQIRQDGAVAVSSGNAAGSVEPAAGVNDATVLPPNGEAASLDKGTGDEVKYTEYVVVKGDSLSLIAKKQYGDGRKYFRILNK